jgi:hypothetical protein
MARGGDCPAPSGPGVEHRGDIEADEVWRAADGPHRITAVVRIAANVTVEACAVITVDANNNIEVGGVAKPGKLTTAGTFADKLLPVVIRPADAAKPWGSVIVKSNGSADLAYTAIVGGDAAGSRQNGGGSLRVFGVSSPSSSGVPTLSKTLKSTWAFVKDSGGVGVNMRSYSGFTDDSTALAVTGAQAEPMAIELGAASALPATLLFERNGRDDITLFQERAGTINTTLKNRGVPYRADGAIDLQPVEDGIAVLTIEAGVTLRFDDTRGRSGISVGVGASRQGQIVAVGTAVEPIVFTSAKPTPAKGDWTGLNFRDTPPTGNRIDFAVIEYAGADSSTVGRGCGPRDNDASVLITTNAAPSSAFITNTKFRSGAGTTGIVSGWISDADGPNFLTSNTFEDMPECKVSRWASTSGCKSSSEPECL